MNIREYATCDGIELARRISAGETTSSELIEHAFAVIAALDDRINAFVTLDHAASLAAAAAQPQGPLGGIPLAMKDCVGFDAGSTRSFGSRLAVGTRIDLDDEVVARYRRAGLIPIGTTNVPEFSSTLTTESKLHGPCRNPWNLEHSVGGSSGGAAAAVASGMVPIAYGNDSAGSIRVPASCCGVFGFRPSRGRVPTGPSMGEGWYGLLSHHVITRSVRDSALVLDMSAGIDVGAPYGAPEPPRAYLAECAPPVESLRIAISDGSAQGFELDPACRTALEETAAVLVSLGHHVERIALSYSGEEMLRNLVTLLAVALAEEIPAISAERQRAIGPETVEACHRALLERGQSVSALELSRVLRYRTDLGRRMGNYFADFDLLLTPTLAQPPIRLGELDSDSPDLDAYLQRLWRFSPFAPLANFCGIPSMSVPLCWSEMNLPIGMMFTAPYAQEGRLFRLAAQLEQARPWRERHPAHSAWQL